MPRRVRGGLVGLCVAALLTACGGSADPAEFHGNPLDPPFEVAATPLVDTTGSPYSLADDTDQPLTLVFFGYTECPDICGLVMSTLATAMTKLSDADRGQVEVVFVTTDPARDTEEKVAQYVQQFDPSFIGLTGDLETIIDVAEPLGVGVEQGEKLPSGGYDVTHGTQVIGIDAADQAPVYWNQDVSAAQLASDIHTLLGE